MFCHKKIIFCFVVNQLIIIKLLYLDSYLKKNKKILCYILKLILLMVFLFIR